MTCSLVCSSLHDDSSPSRIASRWLTWGSRLPEPDRYINRGFCLIPSSRSRVLHCPSSGLPTMPCHMQIGSILGLKESIPFDHSGDLVPPVFLQLPLIFFNLHSQRGFYPLSQLPLHVLLPHANHLSLIVPIAENKCIHYWFEYKSRATYNMFSSLVYRR
jgi:hypothetical protein